MRVALATLGCKINQYESAAFTSGLEEAGCLLVGFAGPADVYVINTCTVTARAGQQSRQLIRRALRANPRARVIVTGCHAQMAPREVLALGEAVTLVGNANKDQLVAAVLGDDAPPLLFDDVHRSRTISPLPATGFSGRTRASLRVQDGCNSFCSYCIVPLARGRSRSLGLAEVMAQAAAFVSGGHRELVVTGINVGKYGQDLNEGETIYSLLERLCLAFPDTRIRLSSIEPTEVNDRILRTVTDRGNFMPHLHIALQSGDDRVLRQMNRRYDSALFTRLVRRLHREVPHIALGCDVLGGFPGETDREADNTCSLLADLPLAYFHVFPYSRRPGTLAAELPGQVPGPVREQRVARLRALGARKEEQFHRSQQGTVVRVLFERRHRTEGLLQGYSGNYLSLLVPGGEDLLGRVAPVRVDALTEDGPRGSLVDEPLVHSSGTL